MFRYQQLDRHPLANAGDFFAPASWASMPGLSCQSLFARGVLAAALASLAASAWAAPSNGNVSSGVGSISASGATTTITQGSDKLAINWDSFNIASGETVNFVQPSSSAIALNRVLGNSASEIYGNLNANGKVFLLNPNGILFGSGASVNVGGLVASTLNLSDSDFMAGNFHFSGSAGSVVNQGTVTAADGGYIVLLGGQVSNQGTLSARLGNVTLAAGSDVTLDFAGDGLLGVSVNQGALQALAENRQLIRADGGQVLLTAKAADALIQAVVNNVGVIEAHAVDTSSGQIRLLGDMSNGVVHVGGTLDASAPNGGNGGSIETSAAKVTVADNARIDTSAASGSTGVWLIDPHDFTVAASGGDISGSTLSANLNTTNVVLESSSGTTTGSSGSGNLLINDNVNWSANTTLTLTASNNVTVQADMTASGNSAGLIINPNTGNGGDAASGSGQFLLSNAAINLSGSNPYLSISGNTYRVINDLASLQAINATLDNATYRYYALGSNIDATATAAWNGGAGFVPLGSNVAEFRGIFEGLGHTVSNLTILRSTSDYVGLVGYASGGSIVRDVGLINPNLSGWSSVGGIIGRSYGNIYNAWVSGGTISGHNDVGGIAGENYNSIANSYSSATVSGVSTIGGVAGASSGQIDNTYASGNVSGTDYVGGLAGASSGMMNNVYASGNVSGVDYVGGLVGFNVNGSLINHAYASGTVSATIYEGALVGYNGTDATVTNSFWLLANGSGFGANDGAIDSATMGLTSAQAGSAATYAAAGWDITNSSGSSLWRIYEGSTLPLLRSFLRPITVTASAPVLRDYDGTTGGSSAYTSSTGASLLGSLNYTSAARDVGSYSTGTGTLTLSGLYSGQNGYDISYGAASLQITPATLTVMANNDSRSVGANPYSGGNGVTYTGFGAGDNAAVLSGSLSYGGSAQGATTLGDYSIRAQGLSAANYRIVYVDGILSLRPAAYSSPGYASAINDNNATSSDKNKSADQGNAALPRDDGHLGSSAPNSELFLRIVNGGMRLPRGLQEAL